MSCDCDRPKIYNAKLVKVRKPHKCCECGFPIGTDEQVEKVDALWDNQFQTIYTCLECVRLRDFLQDKFPYELCCHRELYEFLYNDDLVYSDQDIEEEARAVLPSYDSRFGVIRGRHCIIATFAPWLACKNGKFCLVED